jgi:hypothetical protein
VQNVFTLALFPVKISDYAAPSEACAVKGYVNGVVAALKGVLAEGV